MSKVNSVNSDFLVGMEEKLKDSLDAMKEEIEDHLQAINENTDELNCHSHFLNEMDNKIEMLNEKIESVHLLMIQMMKSSLNENERKILDVLSTSTSLLSCKDVALQAGVSELFVKAHLFSMICKGVPLKEKVIENQSYFSLERKNETQQTVMPEISN